VAELEAVVAGLEGRISDHSVLSLHHAAISLPGGASSDPTDRPLFLLAPLDGREVGDLWSRYYSHLSFTYFNFHVYRTLLRQGIAEVVFARHTDVVAAVNK
jgi:hypothetical protein